MKRKAVANAQAASRQASLRSFHLVRELHNDVVRNISEDGLPCADGIAAACIDRALGVHRGVNRTVDPGWRAMANFPSDQAVSRRYPAD